MIKLFEILAFAVSAAGFGLGAASLLRRKIPRFFRLHVCAAGCYMLEELWVVVNSLLGNGSQDGLITVRLFGFFGCLCFLVCANANEYDKVVDDGNHRQARLLALGAPAALLALYGLYTRCARGSMPAADFVLGFLSICPALFAAYYSCKHLLLPEDAMGFLRATRGLDVLALVFYAANFAYPLADLFLTKTVMSICDLALAGLVFGLVLLCRKGARVWETLI